LGRWLICAIGSTPITSVWTELWKRMAMVEAFRRKERVGWCALEMVLLV
jgi:hypothetical protein